MPRRRAPLRPTVVVNKEVPSSNSFKLSVLSYNLLAQDLISSNPSLYSERDPGHLDWEFRKRNLLSELRLNSMDVSVDISLPLLPTKALLTFVYY